MPNLSYYDQVLAVIDARGKKKAEPSPVDRFVRGAGGFARGVGSTLIEGIKSLPQQAVDFYNLASMGATPQIGPNGEPIQTPEQAAALREAVRTMATYTPLPVPRIGPVFPAMALGGVQAAMGAGEPIQTPTGPQPPPPETVGERLGGAAVGVGFGAPGPVFAGARAAAARFRPRPAPLPAARAPAEAPGGPDRGFEVVFTADGPVVVPRQPGGPSGLPQAEVVGPPQIGAGTAGLRASTVQEGFTPVKSTYQVWLGRSGAPTEPGGKAQKPEFREFKHVEAFSREDAIQQVKDSLGGQRAQGFEFRADEIKATAQAQPKAEVVRLATGKGPTLPPSRPVTAQMRKAEADRTVQAAAPITPQRPSQFNLPPPEAAKGFQAAGAPAEVTATAKEIKPVPSGFSPLGKTFIVRVKPKGAEDWTGQMRLKATAELGALKAARNKLGRDADKYEYEVTLKREKEGAGPPEAAARKGVPKPSAPLRAAVAPKQPPPSAAQEVITIEAGKRKLEGGRSTIVTEAPPETTLKPGEHREVAPGRIEVRLTKESEAAIAERQEKRVLQRRQEQAGPPTGIEERRTAARRAADVVKSRETLASARRDLGEIQAAKSYAELIRIHNRIHPGVNVKDVGSVELRQLLLGETRAILKGAGQIVKAARPKVEAAAEAAPKPPRAISAGREAQVSTPSKSFPVRYEEVPVADLKPSHNPATFEPSRDYPLEQQRDYRGNKIEQMKVIEMARRFELDYILADTPTATDGPPIVSREGYVLGGNARTMALLRGIDEGKIPPAEVQQAVARSGEKFGIPAAGKQTGTIIIRRLTEDTPIEQLSKDTKALNEDFKMAVDPVSDAVARARNMTPDTVDWISGVLNDAGPEATVRSAIFDDPGKLTALMRRLAEDRVIVSSELPRLLDSVTNKLTPEGQRLIEAAVIGRVIRSPRMIREMAPALKNVVLSAISPLTRGETFPQEWRVNNDVVNGLWLHHMAEKAGKTIDMMVQPQLIPEPFLEAVRDNRVAIALARWFDANRSRPTALRTALNKFNANAAESVSGQELLGFIEPVRLPHEALNDAFGLTLKAEDFGTGDGVIYLYSGLPIKALEPLWKAASEKARHLKDWIFIPKDLREPWKPGEPFQEWWERGQLPRTGDSLRNSLRQGWEKFAKAMILNADTKKYPYFHEQIDQYRVEAMGALEKATTATAEIVHPIVYRQDPTGTFKRRPDTEIAVSAKQLNYVIGLADLWGRSREGKLTPANGFPDWAKLPREQVTAILDAELKRALLNASPAVRLAHRNWIKLMDELGREMEKRGVLSTGGKRDWTYAPNIPNNFDWAQMSEVSGLTRRVGEPPRDYVKRALGHLRKHDPNMIRAGLTHTYSVLMDNVTSDFAHSVGRDWDYSPAVWERIEAMAKEQKRSVEAVAKEIPIPHGYTAYRVGLSRHFWEPSTEAEFALQRAIVEDPDVGIRFENLWQIKEYAGTPGTKGARPVYIIPDAIAARLNQFREGRSPLAQLEAHLGRAMSAWKALTLGSVYMSYRLTNIIGDVTNVVARTPGRVPFVPGLKIITQHVPRAFYDIVRAYSKGQTSESLQRTELVGGRQNVRAIAELGDLRAHKDLKPFFEPQRPRGLRPASKLLSAANDMLGRWMIVDAILEGTLRHASVEYLTKQGFPLKRAERFTSEIIADYRNVDAFTARMRRNGVFPFMVWMRQMIPGWIRWFTGANLGKYFEGPGGQAIAPPNVPRPPVTPPKGTDPVLWKMVHSGRYPTGTLAAMTLGIAAPMALLYYWNTVLHRDLDRQIPEFIRRGRTYIINPAWTTTDGRPMVWYTQTPIDAVTGFFGLGNPPDRIKDWAKAAEKGPDVLAKAAWDQMAESVGAVEQGVWDLAGPPVDIMRSFGETAQQIRGERQRAMKTGESAEVGKVVRRNLVRLFGDVVPFGKLATREARQDLEGLPDWAPANLRGTPWGTLYVPMSDAEVKRLRARDRKPSPGLRPIGEAQRSQLQPVGANP